MSILSNVSEDILKGVILPFIKEDKKVIPLKIKNINSYLGYKIYPYNTGYKAEFYVLKRYRDVEEYKYHTDYLYKTYKSLFFKYKCTLRLWIKSYIYDDSGIGIEEGIEYRFSFKRAGLRNIWDNKETSRNFLQEDIDLVGELFYVE